MSILLSGYRRGSGATRLEPQASGTFKTATFDVYGLKALASIAGLPAALASRCIPIVMSRSEPTSPKPRRRLDDDPQAWQAIRDDLHALALEHTEAWTLIFRRQQEH